MRALIAALLCLTAAACGDDIAPVEDPATTSVVGTVTVPAGTLQETGEDCTGFGGYDDIHAGAQVTVTDETGEVLGVGRLREGRVVESAGGCQFRWRVVDVPTDRRIYQVHVGNSQRGEVKYTLDDLAETIELTIGV